MEKTSTGPVDHYFKKVIRIFFLYDDPQKTVKIREEIRWSLYNMIFLYSPNEITDYIDDGSRDIGCAYSVEVDIEYNIDGWPTKSNATAT